jgi:hypothetical protein
MWRLRVVDDEIDSNGPTGRMVEEPAAGANTGSDAGAGGVRRGDWR